MRIHMLVVGMIAAAAVAAGCQCPKGGKAGQGSKSPWHRGPEKMTAMTKSMHACADCHVASLEAGKCAMCQKDMKRMHLLGVEKGEAVLCGCAESCACDAKGVKDGKCACGMTVGKASLRGMYVCPDGCPEVSGKPATCACGKEMKQVE